MDEEAEKRNSEADRGTAGMQTIEVREHFQQPTAREAALLVLLVLQTREQETGKTVTRARLTEITLRRLWARTRISNEFVLEVQEYLLQAGWALFWAGSSYAIIQVSSVEGWARISSKRVNDKLDQIRRGLFDFGQLEPLLLTGARRGEPDVDE